MKYLIIYLYIILLNLNLVYSTSFKYGNGLTIENGTNYFNSQNQIIEIKKKLLESILNDEVVNGSSSSNDNSSTQYPVSQNCKKIFLPTMITNPSMVMFSGVGYNELGNYDSCISLPANLSQYCLFESTIEEFPVLIGVCYPSSNYCSKQDILSLMTSYTILDLILLSNSNLSLNTTMLKCYNHDNPTFTIVGINFGAWVIAAISGFILLQVMLGTFIDYLFLYKLVALRKRYISNNPYSLLDPDNNILNSNNVIIKESTNLNEESDNERELEPPFYFLYFNQFQVPNDHPIIRYLLCFSLIKNFNSLVYSSSSKRYFDSLGGIRTLSTFWVILGHSILYSNMGLGYDNLAFIIQSTEKLFSFQVIPAAEFSVDTFFLLSGFLVVYSVLNQFNRVNNQNRLSFKNSSSNKYGTIKFWFVYLIHRFIRLSPLYYFLLFFSMYVLPIMGTGPAWYKYYEFEKICYSNWWVNLLYINNIYSTLANDCFSWAWYLANDIQFFLITPIIIILFRKSKLLAWLLVIGLIAGCIINTTIISFKYHLTPVFDIMSPSSVTNVNSGIVQDIYRKPWNRIGPYLVGILIAFIYCDPKLNRSVKTIYSIRLLRYFIYLLALFITFFLSYIPYSFFIKEWSNLENASYNGFSHTWFTIGLSLFILATFYGYGGVLKWFLELGIWKFFSKLTYSAYLVHPLVIIYKIYSMPNLLHYSAIEFTYLCIGNITMTFAFSFVIHLLIEKPFINIERLIFSKSN